MAEKPILFSGEMVRAILAGRKTQTRRVITPQFRQMWGQGVGRGDSAYSVHVDIKEPDGSWKWLMCPYGKPGDLLWVRETWQALFDTDTGVDWWEDTPVELRTPEHLADAIYRASHTDEDCSWRPPIHMPRWASRLTLRVTAVRCERLRDISRADCAAEGVAVPPDPGWVMGFADLWDRINAKRGYSWASNPFVWVISFERVSQLEGKNDER